MPKEITKKYSIVSYILHFIQMFKQIHPPPPPHPLKARGIFSLQRHVIHGKVRVTIWRVRVMWVTIWYLKYHELLALAGTSLEELVCQGC